MYEFKSTRSRREAATLDELMQPWVQLLEHIVEKERQTLRRNPLTHFHGGKMGRGMSQEGEGEHRRVVADVAGNKYDGMLPCDDSTKTKPQVNGIGQVLVNTLIVKGEQL